MTNRAHIAEDIGLILARHAPLASITEQSQLQHDLAFDSIDRMSIACEVEDTFGVLLSDDVVDGLTDVASLIDAVCAAVEARKKEAA